MNTAIPDSNNASLGDDGGKPPPLRVGVEGFVAFESKPDAPAPVIDWEHLGGLPVFQMFMAERHAGDDAQPSRALYDEYCQWHADKGYWPNEDPMGRLI
jgi:hypothetical protein